LGVIAALRKGFGFFLMSMGVSTYAKKPKAKIASSKPDEDINSKPPE
jgi:hypothetical protein